MGAVVTCFQLPIAGRRERRALTYPSRRVVSGAFHVTMLGVVPEPGASLSRGGLSSRSLALASSRGEDAGGRRPGSSEGRKGRRNYVGENSVRSVGQSSGPCTPRDVHTVPERQ